MSKLTDANIRAASYNGSVLKLRDGNGLYLHVMPSGKYWRYDYRHHGKRRTLSIGVYPGVSLKKARIDLFAAKSKLAEGLDPSYDKQLRKHINSDHTFSAVARDWIKIQDWSESHRHTVQLRIDKDLTPKIGHMPVQQIKAADVLQVLRIIESRGAIETAHRVKVVSGQIMRFAVAMGLIDTDPCRDLKGALQTPRTKRYGAITEPVKFGKLLRAIDGYDNSTIIAHALKLAPYVALRPGELRGARWSEIDLKGKVWEIPADRMKRGRAHVVPLTKPMIQIIESVKDYTYPGELVFPSLRSKGNPISEGTLNAALKYLGYAGNVHTPHGFRSTFSTMAYESEKFDEDVIEMQLSHADKNRVKAAYKRGEHLKQRRELMLWWSKRVDSMRRSVPSC